MLSFGKAEDESQNLFLTFLITQVIDNWSSFLFDNRVIVIEGNWRKLFLLGGKQNKNEKLPFYVKDSLNIVLWDWDACEINAQVSFQCNLTLFTIYKSSYQFYGLLMGVGRAYFMVGIFYCPTETFSEKKKSKKKKLQKKNQNTYDLIRMNEFFRNRISKTSWETF